MPGKISMLTGAAMGFDRPTTCCSGKPAPNTCHAFSQAPGRDGWAFVMSPPAERQRDGWWCADCAQQLRDMMHERGFAHTSEDIALPPAGTA